MNQPTLPFDARHLARTEDPSTSHAAAKSAKELRSEHHAIILKVLRVYGGDWNADEIAAECGLSRHQIGRRLGELEAHGLARRSGNARPTPSGRMAQCYEAVRT
jgi:predicted ArsR family transcriptional regulator